MIYIFFVITLIQISFVMILSYPNIEGRSANNDKDIANLFASKFGSVWTDLKLPNYCETVVRDDFIDTIALTRNDFVTCFNELDENAGPGPNGIHTFLVKKCSNTLATP